MQKLLFWDISDSSGYTQLNTALPPPYGHEDSNMYFHVAWKKKTGYIKMCDLTNRDACIAECKLNIIQTDLDVI